MLELWLIRHGETDWNTDGRIQGAVDTPLNHLGREQAGLLARRLAGTHFDAVYASDLERAYLTAEAAIPGSPVRRDARLREISAGVYEGKRISDLSPEEAAGWRTWRQNPFDRRVPGGESYTDVMSRVTSFRRTLPVQGRVAVFSHGGAIRALLYTIIGRPDGLPWTFAIANTGITRLLWAPGSVTLVTVNDHAHLEVCDRLKSSPQVPIDGAPSEQTVRGGVWPR